MHVLLILHCAGVRVVLEPPRGLKPTLLRSYASLHPNLNMCTLLILRCVAAVQA
jgi:hypothetical protein